MSSSKPIYTVSVRELVEFVLRRGDLGGSDVNFVGLGRALAGTRGHQRLQGSRPTGYQKEVRLRYELSTAEFVLRIQGRIDGLLATPGEVLLEEIKTVQGTWDHEADPLHWAQARLYAFIYAEQNQCAAISVQLTYLNLDSGKTTEFRENLSIESLSVFFSDTTSVYLDWLRDWHAWRVARDKSIGSLSFPFAQYRPGQRELAKAVYRLLGSGGKIFLEAPTGIGKTVSVFFPAIKALGEGRLERIFYLTARTVGRAVAEKTLGDLRAAGLRLRSLTLTAREKLCARDGKPCEVQSCPCALGYYDRRKDAMRAAFARGEITRPILEEIGGAYQVCPHELSLDLVPWVDAVICDYNYVFDPKAYLRRQFADDAGEYAFLVDEAHNLVDRARDMFSADLEAREIEEVRRAIKAALPACAQSLGRLSRAMRKLGAGAETEAERGEASGESEELELFSSAGPLWSARTDGTRPVEGKRRHGQLNNTGDVRQRRTAALQGAGPDNAGQDPDAVRCRPDLPAEVLTALEEAMVAAERWLARNEPAEFRQALLQLYFRLNAFARTAEIYDEHYATIIESNGATRVRLFNVDPSALLAKALARGKAAVFFSATLTPLDYYRTLLGGEENDPTLQLPSPFPPGNLAVLVADRIRTHFKARSATLEEVVEAIAVLVQARPGNYLVYLPSYQYLSEVYVRFQARCPDLQLLAQRPAMSEPEREAFLAAFSVEHGQTLVGFAVLGGVFAEGIDLVGDRLIGAVVVGVGLPQICIERNLIRHYFDERNGAGFEFAYVFPGMNRILQSSGRVIRSETDRGVVLLIDSRFGEARYRHLFRAWWRAARVRSADEIAAAAGGFWKDGNRE